MFNFISYLSIQKIARVILGGLALFFLGFSAQAQYLQQEFFIGAQPTQMYVQNWQLANRAKDASKSPIIFIHGGSHTGAGWTTTPNGDKGWALQFVDKGWDVYVVDWPGTGRSGVFPGNINIPPQGIVNAVIKLVEKTGPAILIGHSIGGAVAFKTAEQIPDSIKALVALAPAAVEIPNTAVPSAPLGQLAIPSREAVLARFANSALFPKQSFDNYFASLVGTGPAIRNAAVGLTDDLKLDRTKLDIWSKTKVLFLTGEEDRTVSAALSAETARLMNVKITKLSEDWGYPGHGHMFYLEQGQSNIALKTEQWLRGSMPGR